MDDLMNNYFEYILDKINFEGKSDGYRIVLDRMFEMPYSYLKEIPLDANNIEHAREFRNVYLDETGCDLVVAHMQFPRFVSVLEVLVSLAIRVDELISFDSMAFLYRVPLYTSLHCGSLSSGIDLC